MPMGGVVLNAGAAGSTVRRRQGRTSPVRHLVQRRAGHSAQHHQQRPIRQRPADKRIRGFVDG